MSKKVYKWNWDCGRAGSVEGLFVADEQDVANAVGEHIQLGDVLGKFSDVNGTLEENEFTALTDSLAVIEFVEEHGPFGFNPLGYITSVCDECGEDIEVKTQDYWCYDCEYRLCYGCAMDENHETCRPIVHYDKRGELPSV